MRIAVFGAGSDLARALVSRMAALEEDARFELFSRDVAFLERFSRDLAVRFGKRARVHPFDATAYDTHATLVEALFAEPVDVVVVAFGVLGEQARAEQDFEEARKIVEVNYLGAMSLLLHVANRLEAQGSGTVVVFSSVAGDRGRRKNYLYGSAKAGLSAFTSGLRGRLLPRGVRVITVKPGVIRTKMTEHLKTGLLAVGPEVVARDVHRAIRRGRPLVLYTPRRWRLMMAVLRALPEGVFHRLPI